MRFLTLAALASVACAVPAPAAVQISTSSNQFANPLEPVPEEVRIFNIRVKKTLSTKSILHWHPASVTVDIKWDGTPASCTCFKPEKARNDTCNDPRFEMHMENSLNGRDPKVTIVKKEGGEKIPINVDLRVNERSCSKKGLRAKVC